MDTRCQGQIVKQKTEKRVNCKCQPVYTSGGNVYDTQTKTKGTKGWSPEGMVRFNDLHKKVIEDHINNPLFMKNYIELERVSRMRHNTILKKMKKIRHVWL